MSNATITVESLSPHTYRVTVKAATTTRHTVTVSPADHRRLGGTASAEQLLHESFQFLLEREPNTSILTSFDLPLIGRYFPDYEQEIVRRLRSGRP